MNGDDSNETLRGDPGVENAIAGNGGDDNIRGRGKSDLLLGGKGDDTVDGANGHDELYGGQGDDELNGGNGSDTLSGDKGLDLLRGGNGNDTFVINADHVGAENADTILDFDVDRQLRRMTFNDSVEITNVGGQTFCFEETGDGDVVLTIDGELAATFKGSNGPLSAADVLAATAFEGGSPASVKLLDENGDPINYTISGTQGDDGISATPGIGNTIAGNQGDDSLNGAGKDDVLLGGPGDDELSGKNGGDTLFGGGDDDDLSGGNGGDLLQGDRGDDTLDGGNGDDQLIGDNANPSVVGADVFVLDASATGSDTIVDYDAAEGDLVELFNTTGTVEYDTATGLLSDDDGLIATFVDDPDTVNFVDLNGDPFGVFIV